MRIPCLISSKLLFQLLLVACLSVSTVHADEGESYGGDGPEDQERNCFNRAGDPATCVVCQDNPNDPSYNGDNYSPPRTCGNGDNVFTRSEYAIFDARQLAAAKEKLRNHDAYKNGNKGYRFGFDAYLEREADYEKNRNGTYTFPDIEINRAKSGGQRVASVFSNRVNELRQKLIDDMKLDDAEIDAELFAEFFEEELDEDKFEILERIEDDRPNGVDVEVKKNVLTRATLASISGALSSEKALEAAKKDLDEAKNDLAEAKENHQEKLDDALANAEAECRERTARLREERDREFANSVEGSGTSNTTVGIGFKVDE